MNTAQIKIYTTKQYKSTASVVCGYSERWVKTKIQKDLTPQPCLDHSLLEKAVCIHMLSAEQNSQNKFIYDKMCKNHRSNYVCPICGWTIFPNTCDSYLGGR